MKRLLSIILCLSLLLGCMTVLAEGNTVSTPRDNITDTDPPVVVKVICKEKKVKPGDTLHVQVKMDDRSAIKFLRVGTVIAFKPLSYNS